jgi:hypothetical protein
MRALMKTNYQFHCRLEFVDAPPRGMDDVGFSTR